MYYEDHGLDFNYTYTYTVQARDRAPTPNTNAVSTESTGVALVPFTRGSAKKGVSSGVTGRCRRRAMRYLIAFLLLVTPAFGANHYIRDGDSGDGSAWNNAWDQLPSSLVREDVYYFADGSYEAFDLDDAADGTKAIELRKATTGDHGTETGWSAGYGDGQAVFSKNCDISAPYFIINGAVRTTISSGHGFRIDTTSTGKGIRSTNVAADNITIKYVEIAGGGEDGDGAANDLIYVLAASVDSWTLQYNYLHDSGRVHILINDGDDWIVEYNYFDKNESTAGEHSESWSIWGGCDDWIVRYNRFDRYEGTGCIVITNSPGQVADGFDVYGNIFYNGSTGNGIFTGTSATRFFINSKFYNNTIVQNHGALGNSDKQNSDDILWYNNIYYNNTNASFFNTPDAYSGGNWFYENYDSGDNLKDSDFAETGDFVGSEDPFIDSGGQNFNLAQGTAGTSAIDNGVDLGSPYDTDYAGNSRGSGGGWDIGAYEYISGGDVLAPTPDPMTFSTAPAGGVGEVTMEASLATDAEPSNPVNYYFEETSGESGGSNSAWQASRDYTDSGLLESTQYTYRVRAKDSVGNTTAWSNTANATTTPPGGTVGDPVFSPLPGGFLGESVEITLTAEDADYVTYTLDLTDPVAGGNGTQIDNATSFVLWGNAKVKVIGHAAGLDDSEIVEGFFYSKTPTARSTSNTSASSGITGGIGIGL